MMGNVRTVEEKQKNEAENHIRNLEMQGHFKDEIGKIIMAQYRDALNGKQYLKYCRRRIILDLHRFTMGNDQKKNLHLTKYDLENT